MLYKYRILILVLIIFLGFGLRFYAASNLPANYDERINLIVAQEISFNPGAFSLPLVEKMPEGLIAERYLTRIGWYLFGNNLLGARLPSLICGVLIIPVIYIITVSILGAKIALLAAFLFSVSQYSIAQCSDINVHPFLILFSLLSISLFSRAMATNNALLLLSSGLLVSIGFLFKESSIFLLPIFIIYLLITPEYRFWLRKRYFWLFIAICFVFIIPSIYFNLRPEATRFSYIYNETAIAPSLNSAGLYLGELILIILKRFPVLFNYSAVSVDPQYPPGESMFLGVIILLAFFKSSKSSNNFIRLLWVCFVFNFILFCFLRRRDMIDSFLSLGSFLWGLLGLVPGMILASKMILDFMERKPFLGRTLFTVFAVFLIARAIDLVSYPLTCYFPFKDYCIENRHLNWEIRDFLEKGDLESAKDTLRRVYKVTDSKPLYKNKAALKLCEILKKEGKYTESREFASFLLSQDPENNFAVDLFRTGEDK